MKTALYKKHCALGAKMVSFGGWEMPLSYKGVIQEHLVVRSSVGVFDVSHMGRIRIVGKGAEALLDYLSTNKIAGKPNFSATYTVWCNAEGGCVDDVIVYRTNPVDFFAVANAVNRQKDLEHVKRYAKGFDVEVQDRFEEEGILAIQGPKATEVLQKLFPEANDLKPMRFIPALFQGEPVILSATGYTGAGGFEIYASNESIVSLWDILHKQGVEPIGLGARDTLRLEMGYALYGHEISEEIAPTESVSAGTVKWQKKDFLGREALLTLEQSPHKRSEYGIILQEKGIAREGYEVFYEGEKIGRVTSGTFSPSLQKAIAIILVQKPLAVGDKVKVQIREHRAQAEVVLLPFYRSLRSKG